MRNPLKLRSTADVKPTLRERLAGMKAKVSGLGPAADTGRRAMLAGALATTLPLPSLAADAHLSVREAAFLTLVPEILPILRQHRIAEVERHRLYEAGDIEAGPHPGWDDRKAAYAWARRGRDARDANGYHDAWNAANDLAVILASRADPFINDPMRTLPGILLKAALESVGDWWSESALNDLSRCAAEQFGLPFEEPRPFDISKPEDDEDDDA